PSSLPGSTPRVVHTLVTASPTAERGQARVRRNPSKPRSSVNRMDARVKPARDIRVWEIRAHRPLNSWSNCRCHRRSSSGAISTVMTFLCVSISTMPGGFDCTSLRVGSRPNLARNCWHSRLSMKLAASRAAFGCGALAFTPTWPKNSVTGSSAHTSSAPRRAPPAGQFHVPREVRAIIQRSPISARPGRARHRQVAVGNDGAQRRDDAFDKVDAVALAIVLHDGLEPFIIGAVDGDLA